MALDRALSAAIGPRSVVGSQSEGITSPQSPLVPVDVLAAIISRLERLEEAVTRVDDGLQSSREDYAKLSGRIDVIEVTLKSWEEYPPDRVEVQHFDLASGPTTPWSGVDDPTEQWMYDQRVDIPNHWTRQPVCGATASPTDILAMSECFAPSPQQSWAHCGGFHEHTCVRRHNASPSACITSGPEHRSYR